MPINLITPFISLQVDWLTSGMGAILLCACNLPVHS